MRINISRAQPLILFPCLELLSQAEITEHTDRHLTGVAEHSTRRAQPRLTNSSRLCTALLDETMNLYGVLERVACNYVLMQRTSNVARQTLRCFTKDKSTKSAPRAMSCFGGATSRLAERVCLIKPI